MKNIDISFGYLGQPNFQSWSYKFCQKYKFLPTFWIRLFRTYSNSKMYFLKKHQIYFTFLNFDVEISYMRKFDSEKYFWNIERFK